MDSLRGMVDLLRDKVGSGVIVLGSANGDKVSLVAAVSKDLLKSGLHAGKLIKEVAAVVGGGGGAARNGPGRRQGPSRLNEAVEKVCQVVAAQVKEN